MLEVGVALANGQLWKAFHNCSYGMRIVMERIVFDGARGCLIIKLFWMKSSLMSFHNIGALQGFS